jgi:ABC-type sugar transport system substrate-binding protein
MGAATAVENAGLVGKVLLSGVDGDMPVLEKIKAGVIDHTLWKNGLGEGEGAIKLAIQAAKGQPVQDIDVPFEYVTKENVDEYIKKSHERNALAAKYF